VTRTTSRAAAAQQRTAFHRALGDPSRARILELLQEAEAPLDPRALAARLGVPVNTVRSDLRILAEAGLVSPTREERISPGRPRLLYKATTAEPLDAPALASYHLLAQILASSLASSQRNPSARAEEAGRAWGAHLIPKPPPFSSISKEDTIDEVIRLHEQAGFRPELRRTRNAQEIVLRHCPVQEVATTYQSVVCPVHLGLIKGALAALDTGIEADSLEPFAEPGACVAHLTGT